MIGHVTWEQYTPCTVCIIVLTSTLTIDLPYLHLGTTQGVEIEEVPRIDDWSSDVIVIPGGFPFGTYNQTIVYVS